MSCLLHLRHVIHSQRGYPGRALTLNPASQEFFPGAVKASGSAEERYLGGAGGLVAGFWSVLGTVWPPKMMVLVEPKRL